MTTIIEIWKVSTNFSEWRCLIVIFIHDKHTFCNFCHTRGISVAVVNNASDVIQKITLQWRHNGRDGVSNHQPHDRLLNRLYRRRSKKISNIRVTDLCVGNPAQMASDAENVSIWWCHHGATHWHAVRTTRFVLFWLKHAGGFIGSIYPYHSLIWN